MRATGQLDKVKTFPGVGCEWKLHSGPFFKYRNKSGGSGCQDCLQASSSGARLSAVRVVAGDVVINVSRWVQHRKKEPVRPRGRTM